MPIHFHLTLLSQFKRIMVAYPSESRRSEVQGTLIDCFTPKSDYWSCSSLTPVFLRSFFLCLGRQTNYANLHIPIHDGSRMTLNEAASQANFRLGGPENFQARKHAEILSD